MNPRLKDFKSKALTTQPCCRGQDKANPVLGLRLPKWARWCHLPCPGPPAVFCKKMVFFPDNKPFFVRREGTSGPRMRTQHEKMKSNIYNRAARTGDSAYMYISLR